MAAQKNTAASEAPEISSAFPAEVHASVAENAESRVEAHAVILGGAGVYECVIFSGYRRCMGLVEGEPEIERALFRSGEPERDDPCGVACERLVGESHSALGESAGVQRLVQIKAAAVGAYLTIGEREVEHRVAEEQVAAEIPVAGEHSGEVPRRVHSRRRRGASAPALHMYICRGGFRRSSRGAPRRDRPPRTSFR